MAFIMSDFEYKIDLFQGLFRIIIFINTCTSNS